MKKRIISIILAVVILFTVLPWNVMADSSVNSGYFGESNLFWQYDAQTATLQISGTGPMPDMQPDGSDLPWGNLYRKIKTIIIDEGVTSISKFVFMAMVNLTSVSIPNTVTKIDQQAFDYCDKLPEITLPASLTEIDSSAFWRCNGLKTVNCEEGLTVIGGFGDCAGLTTVNLPKSLKEIGEWAFGRTALEQIELPDGLVTIGEIAFSGCASLKEIAIPASVTSIGTDAFMDCTSLRQISVDPANPAYSSVGGILFNKNKTEFLGIPGMLSGNYSIPENITKIPDNAFRNCAKLTGITIPNTVTEIGTEAFFGCSSLESVQIADSVTSIAKSAFEKCTALKSVVLPAGITKINDRTFAECTALESVVLPEGITQIGNEAFDLCKSLISVNIPATVTTVGEYAFSNCHALQQISLPSGLAKISRGAFWYCKALESLSIPAATKTIIENPFFGCQKLQGIWVDQANPNFSSDSSGVMYNKKQNLLIAAPGGLAGVFTISTNPTHIYVNAFRDCDSLTEVVIPASVINIGDRAFLDCDNLKTMKIPNSVTDMGSEVFERCDSLETVEFADSVKKIGHSTFLDCKKLTSVKLPSKLTELSYHMFMNCTAMASIDIPQSVKTIDGSFSGCTSLKEVVVPEGVWNIYQYSFENCTSLTTVHLPVSLQKTAYRMFEGCTSLTDVYYGGNEVDWAKDIKMDDNEQLKTVNIHYTYSESCTGEHTVIQDAKQFQSCTEGGLTAGSHCGVCGTVLEKQTQIPAAEHSWDGGNETKPATETETGIMTYTCTVCGNTKTEDIPMLEKPDVHEHDYAKAECLPTCTEKGYMWYFCHCGDEFKDNYVDPLGHDYVDGICTRCQAADPNYQKPEVPTDPTTPSTTGIVRLAGSTRYKTAFAAADELKEAMGIAKFNTIIVSSGEEFADALAGSYLAAAKSAPILLVKDSTVKAVKEYIQANLNPGGTVYLLGGKVAVPEKMETGLDGFQVKRLGGNTRYDTNLLILKEAGVAGKDIVVCTGKDFADSLSASAVGLPILLVKDSLNSAQKEFLTGNTGKIYIVGGKNAVSEKAEGQLAAYGTVMRLAGNTRYQTSVLVAQTFFASPKAAVVAYGKNFPDGLSGGPVANAIGAPLILTEAGKEQTASTYITQTGITGGYVLGGTTVLPEKTVNKVFGK